MCHDNDNCHMRRARATREQNKTRGQWDKNSRLAARAAHTANADVDVPERGHAPVPERRPQEPRDAEPRGAPAPHAAVTVSGPIGSITASAQYVSYQSQHHSQTFPLISWSPGIRGFLANRLHLVMSISCKPGVAIQCCRIIAKKPSDVVLARQAYSHSAQSAGDSHQRSYPTCNTRTVDTITGLQPHLS